MAQKSLHPANYLPLWDIIDDTVVTSQGIYLKGFKLRGLDWQTSDGEVLLKSAQSLYTNLQTELPDHTLLQFVVHSHRDHRDLWSRYRQFAPKEPILAHQRERRIDYLRQKMFLRREIYLMVGLAKPLGGREFGHLSAALHNQRLQEACEIKIKVAALLRQAGVLSLPLTEDGLLKLYYGALNNKNFLPRITRLPDLLSEEVLKQNPYLRTRTVREQLMETPISWHEDYLRIGQRYNKVLTLLELPTETQFTLAEWFVRLNLDYRLSLNVLYPNQQQVQAKFQRDRRMTTATAHRQHVSDDRALGKKEQADQLSQILALSGQKLIFLGAQVVLSSASYKRLTRKVRYFQEQMKEHHFTWFEENLAHDQEFFKTLPGMATTFDRYRMVTSHNGADLLPIFATPEGDREPVLLLETPDKTLYSYDPLELIRDNWNGAVFGASGSGKSVFMNMLISHAMLGHQKTCGRVMVVDFAGETKSSYLNVAELFGGRYIPIVSDRGATINPFPQREHALEKGELKAGVFNYLLVLTDLLLANTGRDKESGLYRVLLGQALKAVYRDNSAPRYQDLLAALKSLDAKKNEQEFLQVLCTLLQGFLESPNARLFNSPSTISEAPFTIFDLHGVDNLPDNVREAMVFLVCWWVKQVAFDPSDQGVSYIILDEVAQLIRQPSMVELFQELYSTSRKHMTSVWTVTQKYQDYVKSAIASTAKVNSTSLILLDHSGARDAKEQVIIDWELNGREAHLFRNLRTLKGEYSELLLRSEVYENETKLRQSAKVRLYLSPYDYEVATSDAQDRKRQQELLESCPGLSLAEVLDILSQKRRGP